MKQNKFYKKGSALIITLLVITVVSAMIFSVGRLAVDELKMSTQLEDSDMAYYAAEAGIEAGLLMFRFNRDVELSQDCQSPNACTSGPTLTSGEPVKFDLGDNQSFDLKIYYKQEGGIGNPDLNDPFNPILKKDQPTQISGFENTDIITLKYTTPCIDSNFQGFCNTTPAQDGEIAHGAEVKRIDANGEAIEPVLFYDEYEDGRASTSGKDIPLNGASLIRIKPWNTDIRYSITAEPITTDPAKIGANTTYIDSTGYFGKSKRKLQIQVDRVSGTILGLYDFVILGREGFSAPAPNP